MYMCARIFAAAASLFCFVASSLILIRITIYCATLAAGVARSRCLLLLLLLPCLFFSSIFLGFFPSICCCCVVANISSELCHCCISSRYISRLPSSAQFCPFYFPQIRLVPFCFLLSTRFVFIFVLAFLFAGWTAHLLLLILFFYCPLLLFYCCYFPRWPTASLASLIFSCFVLLHFLPACLPPFNPSIRPRYNCVISLLFDFYSYFCFFLLTHAYIHTHTVVSEFDFICFFFCFFFDSLRFLALPLIRKNCFAIDVAAAEVKTIIASAAAEFAAAASSCFSALRFHFVCQYFCCEFLTIFLIAFSCQISCCN